MSALTKKESNIVSWRYAGEADVTIGETYQSKVSKVVLICLVITLVSAVTLIVMNWALVYDYIANPSIILSSNTVDIEVGTTFDPNSFIVPRSQEDIQNGVYTYEIQGADMVNTNDRAKLAIDPNTKIINTYEVHYISTNDAKSTDQVLTVNVVDRTAPVITLTQENAFLVKGVQTGEYFDAQSFVESIHDNYTYDENLKNEHAEGNWNTPINVQTGFAQIDVIYTSTDEAGNVGTATLHIYIFEDEELRDQFEQEQAEEAVRQGLATPTPTPSPTPTPTPEPTSPPETQPPETEATSSGGGNSGGGGGGSSEPENPSPDTSSFSCHDITYSLSNGADGAYMALPSTVDDYGGVGYCYPEVEGGQAVPGGSWTVHWIDSAGVVVGTCHVYFTD